MGSHNDRNSDAYKLIVICIKTRNQTQRICIKRYKEMFHLITAPYLTIIPSGFLPLEDVGSYLLEVQKI